MSAQSQQSQRLMCRTCGDGENLTWEVTLTVGGLGDGATATLVCAACREARVLDLQDGPPEEVLGQAACGLAFDLGRLQAVAAEAVCEFEDFVGQASTYGSARHALHRLGRWLEATGQRTFLRDPLWWRLVYFDSLEHAGFRTGEDEQVRKLLPGQPAWQRAHGPTLAEEVERLRYERDELRERLAQQDGPNWARWIGPCIHGRDPWTRCEEGCAEAGEVQALAWRVEQLEADADGKKAAP